MELGNFGVLDAVLCVSVVLLTWRQAVLTRHLHEGRLDRKQANHAGYECRARLRERQAHGLAEAKKYAGKLYDELRMRMDVVGEEDYRDHRAALCAELPDGGDDVVRRLRMLQCIAQEQGWEC